MKATQKLAELFPERVLGTEEGQPLIRWRNGGRICREDTQRGSEEAAEAVGLPAGRFRPHSLRSGGDSAMMRATGQSDLLKKFGRWRSNTVHIHLHDAAEQYEGRTQDKANDRSAVYHTRVGPPVAHGAAGGVADVQRGEGWCCLAAEGFLGQGSAGIWACR